MTSLELLERSPVIAAIKNDNGLRRSLDSECEVVFVLYGNICNIPEIVDTIKEHGKHAMIHADMVQGLGTKEIAVDFLKKNTRADGIISTKPLIVRRARELDMTGILRAFLIDSMAIESTKKLLESCRPDMIEIMPGVMPKIIRRLRPDISIPIIAGGLIAEKKEIMELLSAGADAISTTREELWFL
ncbi:MAG: glycerol-3-phosphate responsive antiterminator [Clostridiales bacterium]|nr:glycerol-3-phosphate responsive antiterminator [Clostridiales bacterium]